MIGFIAKRVLSGFITLILFVSLLFVLANVLVPGDYYDVFRFGLTPENVNALRRGLGLDLPLWRQYLSFVGSLLTGDLGFSYRGFPVWNLVSALLPWTLTIFTIGMGLAFTVGQWLGRFIAWRRPSRLASAATVGAVASYTIFPVLLAFLILVGYDRLLGFRARAAMTTIPAQSSHLATLWTILGTVIGLALFALWVSSRRVRLGHNSLPVWMHTLLIVLGALALWTVLGIRSEALDLLYFSSLPILAVAVLSVGEITLIVDSSMVDTAREDFVQAARARGLPDRMVRDRHAARVALLPVLSKLLVSIPFFLTGLVIIEKSFETPVMLGLSIPVRGLSAAMFDSMAGRDFPVVLGALFAIGVLMLVLRIVLDVLHAYLDPRIRYGGREFL